MKKQKIINLIKEAAQIQGKRWCAGALIEIALAMVFSVIAFNVGMPIEGSLAIAGIFALFFSFYWFAMKPLIVDEVEEE